MNDLLMQIEINERKMNRKTYFDDIVKVKIKYNQFLYIEDIDGWSTFFKMLQDIIVTIEFTPIVRGE